MSVLKTKQTTRIILERALIGIHFPLAEYKTHSERLYRFHLLKYSIVLVSPKHQKPGARSLHIFRRFSGNIFSVWPSGAGGLVKLLEGHAKSGVVATRKGGTRNWRRVHGEKYIRGPKVQGAATLSSARRICLRGGCGRYEGRNHPAKPPWFHEINPHIMSPGIIRKTHREMRSTRVYRSICVHRVAPNERTLHVVYGVFIRLKTWFFVEGL